MVSFTLRGRRGCQTDVVLTWEDGTLSGYKNAIAMVQLLAEAYEGQLMVFSEGAPSSRHDHLQNPWAACELMCMVFWGLPRQVAGSMPRIPPPPKGAVR